MRYTNADEKLIGTLSTISFQLSQSVGMVLDSYDELEASYRYLTEFEDEDDPRAVDDFDRTIVDMRYYGDNFSKDLASLDRNLSKMIDARSRLANILGENK